MNWSTLKHGNSYGKSQANQRLLPSDTCTGQIKPFEAMSAVLPPGGVWYRQSNQNKILRKAVGTVRVVDDV